MRCIYRITCLVNGKNYVGQARDANKREINHMSRLRRQKHHNKALQSDYDKFGSDQFAFELIEEGIYAENIDIREKFWITHFDSFTNGYNRTDDGRGGVPGVRKPNSPRKRPTAIKCTWNGIDYDSIADCARANKVLTATMRKCILQGFKSDEDYPPIQKFRREQWVTQHQARPRSRKSAPDVLSTNAPSKGRIS